LFSLLSLGFLIGITHAFEADHLAALAALVSGKTDRRVIIRHGFLWGAGHALVLALVGGIVLGTGHVVSPQASFGLELTVGATLVLLGGHVLFRLHRERAHFHRHQHENGTSHFHLHSHRNQSETHDRTRHIHRHPDKSARRTLLVGMMHGAAGSAALVLVAASTINSPFTGLLYISLFGLGSILGMIVMSLVIAQPLAWSAKIMTRANTGLQAIVGFITIGIGISMFWENTLALLG